jgi:hypothetical protein
MSLIYISAGFPPPPRFVFSPTELGRTQYLANHERPRMTKLYDWWAEEISLDEVEKISI